MRQIYNSFARHKVYKFITVSLKHCEILITYYNTVILVCNLIKLSAEIVSLSRSLNNSGIGNFMKRLCFCLFQWLFFDQISFETKQKSKYKVDLILFSFQLIKIFWKYPKFFGENPGTNQNLTEHVKFTMK